MQNIQPVNCQVINKIKKKKQLPCHMKRWEIRQALIPRR